MIYEKVNYFEDLPIGLEVNNIHYYPWHRHHNCIEILFVLKGKLNIKASCDYYTLKKGDISIVNHDTFHNIHGVDEENIAISLFVDLEYYANHFVHIFYIVFILESLKTAEKYREKFADMKHMMSKIIIEMSAKKEGYKEKLSEISFELVEYLVDHFTEVNYYNDYINFNSIKLERYFRIRKYIEDNFCDKTLLEDISSKEYFSKSYISHLFKEVSTFSLKEIICFIRNFKSEELLLTTKWSISKISEECGYSDTKYYYRHFKKWYLCTPSEYRKMYQKEINSDLLVEKIHINRIISELNPFLSTTRKEDYLKTQNILLYLFEDNILPVTNMNGETDYDWYRVTEVIDALIQKNLNLCIAINYKRRSQKEWKKIFKECIEIFGREKMKGWKFWITYDDLDSTDEVNQFVSKLEDILGNIKIESMMVIQNIKEW